LKVIKAIIIITHTHTQIVYVYTHLWMDYTMHLPIPCVRRLSNTWPKMHDHKWMSHDTCEGVMSHTMDHVLRADESFVTYKWVYYVYPSHVAE